jgi:tetratricopeptide (TPR) repeat protein
MPARQPSRRRPLIAADECEPVSEAKVYWPPPSPPDLGSYATPKLVPSSRAPDQVDPERCMCRGLRRMRTRPGKAVQDTRSLTDNLVRWADDSDYGSMRWRPSGGGWLPSPVTVVVLSAALALAGNLATNTVRVDWRLWPLVAWTGFALLLLGAVAIEKARSESMTDISSRVVEDALTALASKVRAQWVREAVQRQVRQPVPLMVRWSSTDRPVAAGWDAILEGAGGAGSRLLPFEGDAGEIVKAYRRLPHGQLVILGEPGAGKSVLAMLLTLGLIEDPAPGQPIPVLLAITSWKPTIEDPADFLIRRLVEEYGALGRRGVNGEALAKVLVSDGRVLPVFDGLDELPAQWHSRALESLDRFAAEGRPVVVTCRSREYEQAVNNSGSVLSRGAVVEIGPVQIEQAISFLSDPAPGRPRWQPVFDSLREHPNGPLALVLSTPLMVALARVAYHSPAKKPIALLKLSDRSAIEDALIAGFMSSVYQPELPGPPVATTRRLRAYGPDLVVRWLGCIAYQLHNADTIDLWWWQLRSDRPMHVSKLASFLLSTVTFLAVIFCMAGGVAAGLAAGTRALDWAALTAGSLVAITAVGLSQPLWRVHGRYPFSGHKFLRRGRSFLVRIAISLSAWYGLTLGALAGFRVAIWAGIVIILIVILGDIKLFLPAQSNDRSLTLLDYRLKAVSGGTAPSTGKYVASFYFGLSLILLIDVVATRTGHKIGLDGLALVAVWSVIAVVSIIAAGSRGLLRPLWPAGPPPYVPLRYRTPRRRRIQRLVAWIAFGLYFGSLTGLMLNAIIVGLEGGIVYGLAVAMLPFWSGPFRSQPSSPNVALKANHRNASLAAIQHGLAAGLIFGVITELSSARPNAIVAGVYAALVCALAAAYGAGLGTWAQFRLNHTMLAASGWLPWRLCAFLADAHSRGVLRQAGTAWQFRHALLQKYLADIVQQEHQGPQAEEYSWDGWLYRLYEIRKNRIVLYKWSARCRQAAFLARRGRTDKAIEILETYSKQDSIMATCRLADLLAKQGRIDEAIEALKPHATDRWVVAHRLAEIHSGRDEIEEAIETLKAHAAWRRIADLLAGQGRIDEAIETLKPHVTEQGIAPKLADLLAGQGRIDEAIETLKPHVTEQEIAPKLADLLAGQGRIDEAIETLKPYVVNDDSHARQLDELLAQHDRIDELRARPKHDEHASRMLDLLLVKHGLIDELRARAKRDGHASRMLVNLLFRTGRMDELSARAKYDQYAASRMALYLTVTNRMDEAIALLWPHVNANGSDAVVELADLLVRVDRTDEAVGLLRARTNAGDAEAAEKLAYLLTRLGRADEGLAIVRMRADAGDQLAVQRLSTRLARLKHHR